MVDILHYGWYLISIYIYLLGDVYIYIYISTTLHIYVYIYTTWLISMVDICISISMGDIYMVDILHYGWYLISISIYIYIYLAISIYLRLYTHIYIYYMVDIYGWYMYIYIYGWYIYIYMVDILHYGWYLISIYIYLLGNIYISTTLHTHIYTTWLISMVDICISISMGDIYIYMVDILHYGWYLISIYIYLLGDIYISTTLHTYIYILHGWYLWLICISISMGDIYIYIWLISFTMVDINIYLYIQLSMYGVITIDENIAIDGRIVSIYIYIYLYMYTYIWDITIVFNENIAINGNIVLIWSFIYMESHGNISVNGILWVWDR